MAFENTNIVRRDNKIIVKNVSALGDAGVIELYSDDETTKVGEITAAGIGDFTTIKRGGNKVTESILVPATLDGAAAATAANYGVFFIAPFACEVVSVRAAHTAAGTDAGAVTLDVEKLTGTQAPDAGVSVLGATINLKGAANTVQVPALTGTTANKQLAAGDRLCLKDAGTLTAVAGVAVTVELKAI